MPSAASPYQSHALFGLIFLNNRGLYVPKPTLTPDLWLAVAALAAGLTAAIYLWRRAGGSAGSGTRAACLALAIGPAALAAALAEPIAGWSVPQLRGFSFEGGMVLIPEFVGLVLGLSFYTGAYIAENVRSNVRELEGCIIKLLLFASLKHREITIELAREALSDRIKAEEPGPRAPASLPTIDRVQEVVARRWGVTPEGLRSKARIKTLTVPRQIAMYLARELLQMQLVEIGQSFGGRDHSTVIHSVDKVQRQMARDRTFRERVELARQELCAQ